MTSGIVTNASWLFPCDMELSETIAVGHTGGGVGDKNALR